MSEITGTDLREYVDARQTDGAANSSIDRELAALRRMFTPAIDSGKLIAKPKIRMLAENNARQRVFEREQFAEVLTRLSAALQAVATLANWTGWLRSEILALDWQRADRKAQIVRLDVGSTKNRDGPRWTAENRPRSRTARSRMYARCWSARGRA